MQPDALNQNHENQPQSYSLSREEFDTPPVEIRPYNPGERITRDNFINFLILSFAISMGRPKIQILFMRWLKVRFGFDYLLTLRNFVNSGGWKNLSDNEKDRFKYAFDKVRKHEKDPKFIKIEVVLNNEVAKLYNQDNDTKKYHNWDMKNVNTFTEFSKLAHEQIGIRG